MVTTALFALLAAFPAFAQQGPFEEIYVEPASELVAHELTHIVQSGGAADLELVFHVSDDDAYEAAEWVRPCPAHLTVLDADGWQTDGDVARIVEQDDGTLTFHVVGFTRDDLWAVLKVGGGAFAEDRTYDYLVQMVVDTGYDYAHEDSAVSVRVVSDTAFTTCGCSHL